MDSKTNDLSGEYTFKTGGAIDNCNVPWPYPNWYYPNPIYNPGYNAPLIIYDSSFKYWLEGFLEGKKSIFGEDLNLIRKKMKEL